jgi:hypothetical protein
MAPIVINIPVTSATTTPSMGNQIVASIDSIKAITGPKLEETSITFGQKVEFPSQEKGKVELVGEGLYQNGTIVEVLNSSQKISPDKNPIMQIIIAAASTTSNKITTNIKVNLERDENEKIYGTTNSDVFIKNMEGAKDTTKKEIAIVLGSIYKNKSDILKIINESKKVDLELAFHSKESPVLEFNSLQVPTLKQKIVYNFYTESEENVSFEEDPKNDPLFKTNLNKTPRYIRLSWIPVSIREPVRHETKKGKDEKQKNNDYFGTPKGAVSLNGNSNIENKNSYTTQQNKTTPIIKDGMTLKLIDTHSLDKAFDLNSNSTIYQNSIDVITGITESKSTIQNALVEVLTEKETEKKEEEEKTSTTDTQATPPSTTFVAPTKTSTTLTNQISRSPLKTLGGR